MVAGLVVRHGDLSHKMTLLPEGRRPECDNVNRDLSHRMTLLPEGRRPECDKVNRV